MKNSDSFKYLGSIISSDGSLDNEIEARISKASQALGRLKHKILKQHNIRLRTKIKVYNAVVLPSLLYGCESWTLYRKQLNQLEKFHQRALRSILGIRWHDRITNLEVFDRSNSTSIETLLIKAQLRWVGHVIRMEDFRMPKRLLYGELASGSRNRGRPKKRFKDWIKTGLPLAGILPQELEAQAADRDSWRRAVHQAGVRHEEAFREKQILQREKRHNNVPNRASFPCPHCNRPVLPELDFTAT